MTRTCQTCQETFEFSSNINPNPAACYDCALESICGDFAPEEGDFNSARLASGKSHGEEVDQLIREEMMAIDHSDREDDDGGDYDWYEDESNW